MPEEPQQPDKPDEALQEMVAQLYQMWAEPSYSSTHLFNIKHMLDDDTTLALDGEAFNSEIILIRTFIAARILAHWEATSHPAKAVRVLVSIETFSRREDLEDDDVQLPST